MNSSMKRQTGASFFSILIVLIVAGFLFTIAFKLFPAYVDNRTVDAVLTEAMADQEELAKGPTMMRADIRKKLTINQVKLPSYDAITIIKEDGYIITNLEYEVRIPMFGNVDAIVSFNKEYEAEAP